MQVPIEESSTNDATSSRQSTTNTSFSQNDATNNNNNTSAGAPGAAGEHAKLNVLTTDGIIKECIKQGFYRNPICNEKLYLHNKSYDAVAPTAFDLYTDVKVLWLEGNALRSLPIGGTYIQTRPPKNKYAFLDEEEEEQEDENEETAATAPPSHVDPMQQVGNTPTAAEDGDEGEDDIATAIKNKKKKLQEEAARLKQEKKEQKLIKKELAEAAALLPEPQEIVDDTQKDAFSSLYPTVRQLYLHNNLFRTMPDLHRFQLLDSVHLGNNFFSSVVPFCPYWDQKIEAVVAQLRQEEDTNGEALAADTMRTVTDSLLQHLLGRQLEAAAAATAADAATDVTVQPAETKSKKETDQTEDGTMVLSTEAAEKQRDALLQLYKKLTERCYTLCEHAPVALGDGAGALPAAIPTAQRSPCSTLRTINLSQNRLSEFTDVLPLLAYHAVTTLDLSNNQLHDGEGLLLILEKLPRLLSLKLQGNPLTRTLRRYRQRVLSHCKKLVYLDDRPVFEDERRLVTAWAKGGDAAVNKERELIKEENEAKQKKRLDDFRALLANARTNAADGDTGAAAAVAAHRNNNSNSGDAYIAAVTTDAALAAVGQQQHHPPRQHETENGGTGDVVYENHYRIQNATRNERRPDDEERDDSPTSEDEDEDSEGGTPTTATAAVAGEEGEGSAAVADNKPKEKQGKGTSTNTRVLSTNRSPATTTATTINPNDVDDGDNDDDVYIPSA